MQYVVSFLAERGCDSLASEQNAGDAQLAELVQDLHWIANDALAHPLDVAMVVQG